MWLLLKMQNSLSNVPGGPALSNLKKPTGKLSDFFLFSF